MRPVRQTWHGLPESQAQAAGFSGKFAGSSVYPPGLIEVEHKSIALDGGRLKQGQQFFEGPEPLPSEKRRLSRDENSERSVPSVPEQLTPEQLAEANRIATELVKLRDAGAISGGERPRSRLLRAPAPYVRRGVYRQAASAYF